MSSSEQRAQGSDYPASSSEAKHDAQAKQQEPESVSSAGEHMNQQTDSTVEKVASQSPQPPARPERPTPSAGSPSVGEPQAKEPGADMSDTSVLSQKSHQNESNEADTVRPLPIPPASEPMQYRAIGLIRGKYMPSEEQFTRGNLLTDDGTEVDAVLLGRVMSLVRKHIELDEPHLWVVYPRTRNKDSQLHAQIVGVWEPEKLNRDDEAIDESDSADTPTSKADDTQVTEDAIVEQVETSTTSDKTVASDSSSEAIATEPAESVANAIEETVSTTNSNVADSTEESSDPGAAEEAIASPEMSQAEAGESGTTTEAATPDAESPATTSGESSDSDLLPAPKPPKTPAAPSAAPAVATRTDGSPEMIHDGYFSIRGEILKHSPEESLLTVKIRQAPRKAGTDPKAFNLILHGKIEGRTTGYFWELDVQRQGNNLVVQEGSMIRMVPPSKSKRKGGEPRDGKRRGGGAPRPRSNRPSQPPTNRSTPKPTIRPKSAPPQSSEETSPAEEKE